MKKKNKKWLIIVPVVFLVFSALVGYFYSNNFGLSIGSINEPIKSFGAGVYTVTSAMNNIPFALTVDQTKDIGTCFVDDNRMAGCVVGVQSVNYVDLANVGWTKTPEKSCVGFMNYFGCDYDSCIWQDTRNTGTLGSCAGSTTDSPDCHYDTDCSPSEYCEWGDCKTASFTCPSGVYKCVGSGAIERCSNNRWSFYANCDDLVGKAPDCENEKLDATYANTCKDATPEQMSSTEKVIVDKIELYTKENSSYVFSPADFICENSFECGANEICYDEDKICHPAICLEGQIFNPKTKYCIDEDKVDVAVKELVDYTDLKKETIQSGQTPTTPKPIIAPYQKLNDKGEAVIDYNKLLTTDGLKAYYEDNRVLSISIIISLAVLIIALVVYFTGKKKQGFSF